MKLKAVRYGMTRKTETPYEYDRIEVEIEVEEGEKFIDVKAKARALCLIGLGQVTDKDLKEARELVALFGSAGAFDGFSEEAKK